MPKNILVLTSCMLYEIWGAQHPFQPQNPLLTMDYLSSITGPSRPTCENLERMVIRICNWAWGFYWTNYNLQVRFGLLLQKVTQHWTRIIQTWKIGTYYYFILKISNELVNCRNKIGGKNMLQVHIGFILHFRLKKFQAHFNYCWSKEDSEV